ncbi:MAG: hypothetical protein OEQ14_09210 [Gammaproteobacteria bacterium]|nr:hypothetical protein [Gammaproteobacteria bacterium]
MKYLASLLLGMLVGVATFFALLYYNPLTSHNKLSPLSVSDNDLITLNYSAVAADALIYTNNGESRVAPHPSKVQQLWERPIRQSDVVATTLTDSRGQVVGLGVKFSSDSEKTKLLNSELIVDSVWHIYLPGQGTLFVEQQENYWAYLREIVIPAYWNSGDNWRGIWNGSITSGPGALGTARVVGGSGRFSGLVTEGVESLAAKAFSVKQGPVAMTAEVMIELPRPESESNPDL